jgi:hypothetical protein
MQRKIDNDREWKKIYTWKRIFFRPFCLLYLDRSAAKTFESGSNHLFLWTRVVFQKKWFCGFLFGINIMTKECFCAYTPGTFRFIPLRSLSDTASECFISTPVFPEIGMQKNLSILNRCGTLFQSAALIDFAVFLLITASFWSKCFRTTSGRSSASLRVASHG